MQFPTTPVVLSPIDFVSSPKLEKHDNIVGDFRPKKRKWKKKERNVTWAWAYSPKLNLAQPNSGYILWFMAQTIFHNI